MSWQKGPLPKDTYGWGGVVPVGDDPSKGFFFADFCGNTIKVIGGKEAKILKAEEVLLYDNSLELPPLEV